MKKLTTLTMLLFLFISCGESDKKAQNSESILETEIIESKIKDEVASNSGNTPLCKINGDVWSYTSNNGIVSRNSDTKVRTATIGFTKKLDKGSESIQVEYDVDKNILNNVWVQLKLPNKEGNIATAFYTQYGNKIDLTPGASLTGTVSLNEKTRKVSGSATITVLNDEKRNYELNTKYSKINITDLNFSDVSYSDTDDLKKIN